MGGSSMRSPRIRRRLLALLSLVAAGGGLVLALQGSRSSAAPAAAAQRGEVRVARSVCEAHVLRALKAEQPDVRIEIPPEYDKAYPSAAACRSHELAWDEHAPGPNQPIPFSHAHHAGLYEIQCLYCHSGTDRSQAAGVPSLELCMGCHAQFSSDYDQLEGIRILKGHWGIEFEQQNGKWDALDRDPATARPIEWVQVHRLPEHVQFRHNRHVAAEIACQRCHGPVEQMEKLYLTPDTVWWQYGLPAKKLEMGWCIQCHRENGASQDCLTCHY